MQLKTVIFLTGGSAKKKIVLMYQKTLKLFAKRFDIYSTKSRTIEIYS